MAHPHNAGFVLVAFVKEHLLERRFFETMKGRYMRMKQAYTFRATVWLWSGDMAAWHFVSVPKTISQSIKKSQMGRQRRGWGSLSVTVTIGHTTWQTSIFPDAKSGTYVLPLKAQIRKQESIAAHNTVRVSMTMRGL